MTQELTPQPATDNPESDDAGLASMLSDAYDAPPVPKSLVKRLDRGIEEQWGHSPELTPSRLAGAMSWTRSSATLMRSWPVAAALAAVLMLAFIFGGGSKGYAWASVVDAMKRHGLIEINADSGVRWLDLAASAAGQQTDQRTQWMNMQQRWVLTRVKESNTLQRSRLQSDLKTVNSTSLLAAFLLDEPLSTGTLDRFSGITVVEERWEEKMHQGRDVIDLHVRFQNPSREVFSLSLLLDPASDLPIGVCSVEGEVSAVTYRRESAEDLQATHFPADLLVVSSSADLPDAIASADRRAEADRPIASQNDVGVSPGAMSVTHLEVIPPKTVEPMEHQLTNAATLPVGEAKKWVPVTLVPRTDAEVLQRVDWVLEELWKKQQVTPVAAASDLELLRRAYLDLVGRTPTVTEVRHYLKDGSGDRYERLVDQLLESPDHASQMAAVWRSFLIPEGVDLVAFGGREAFEKWMAERFAAGEPYDQIVRKLLLAEGRLSQSGPLLFYSALKLDADQLASRTSRVFLGMRLECAQCHDHPFESWTQEEFWSYAAFFAQISRPKGELESVSTVMRVRDIDRGDVMIPETETIVPPRFLGQPIEASQPDGEKEARRAQLAKWLTGPDNPYFARATVNRVWSLLFGRGIVDPVDDFGENNQPISPELLDTLASQFIESGFDLKKLIRSIALSKAYRLSSSSSDLEEADADAEKRLESFAQMNVKTLTAEQLYDCITVATMVDNNAAANEYTLARFGNSQREEFLQQFAAPAANRAEYLAGIPQALMLMNGTLITGATGEKSSGLIQSLQAPFFTDPQRIDVLFMATLSRPATEEEAKLLADFLPADATPEDRSAGLSDLLWALINSAEFTLNH